MYIPPLNRERRGCSSQPGFLLIEIMIAFVIMTAMTLMIAHYQGHIAQGQRNMSYRLQAVDILSSFLDELVFLQKLPNASSIQQDTFAIRWSAKNYFHFVKNMGTNFTKNFYIIDAQVSWQNAFGKIETISMSTGVYVT